MDRGYVDFERLYKFVLASSFFVTRAKSNFTISAPTVEGMPLQRNKRKITPTN